MSIRNHLPQSRSPILNNPLDDILSRIDKLNELRVPVDCLTPILGHVYEEGLITYTELVILIIKLHEDRGIPLKQDSFLLEVETFE